MVSSLDYCNSLYANFPQAQIDRIQSVFNGAARLIFGASRFSVIVFTGSTVRIGYVTNSALLSLKRFMEWRLATLLITVYWRSAMKGDQRYDLRRHLALDLLCQDDHLAPDSATGLFMWRDQLLGTCLHESITLIPTIYSFKRQFKTYLFCISFV